LATGGALAACLLASPSLAAEPAAGADRNYQFCGEPLEANAFGRPLDYNSAADAKHVVGVEGHHFSKDVEFLRRGQTSESPIDDLAYVLRQIPNHHRALAAMSNFQFKKGYRPEYASNRIYTSDCYFRRSLSFDLGDALVHLMYGAYLHKAGEQEPALAEYLLARDLGLETAEVHYNLGLLYVDLKQYEAARREAHKAYAMDYPLLGLRIRLERLGEWSEN